MSMKSILSLALILIILASPAWAGCGRWVVRDNTDFLADPLFDAAMESSTGINATSGSEAPAAENQTEDESSAPASTEAAVQKAAPVIDLAGKWKISMTGDGSEAAGRSMDIILIQSADRLQGYGTITEGSSDVTATATGAVSNDGISLEVKVGSQKKDYRLDLVNEGGRLQGSYELYQAEKLAESGNATASRAGS
ncbi:MAG: hypothetical protein LUQ15_04100 [Methanothrix sp.]|nr:hypothetical protein [Methanothrix sp.]OYV09519.1 MAG: lipoprotein [Methanosaeta sp. NSP1]